MKMQLNNETNKTYSSSFGLPSEFGINLYGQTTMHYSIGSYEETEIKMQLNTKTNKTYSSSFGLASESGGGCAFEGLDGMS